MNTRERISSRQSEVLFIPNRDVESLQNADPENEKSVCVGYHNGRPIMLEQEKESPVFMGYARGEEVWVEL